MSLILKRFSQDVDLVNTGNTYNYLVFDADGKEVRLPVPEETILALIKINVELQKTAVSSHEESMRKMADNIMSAIDKEFPNEESVELPDELGEGAEEFGADDEIPGFAFESEDEVPAL